MQLTVKACFNFYIMKNYNEWSDEELINLMKLLYPSGTIIQSLMGPEKLTVDWDIHECLVKSTDRKEDVELIIEYNKVSNTLLWADYETSPYNVEFAKIISSSISEEWKKLKHIIYD